MTQIELRRIFIKFTLEASIPERHESLEMFSNFLLKVVQKHHNDKVDNIANAQARLILQMVLAKVIHIRSFTEGITFIADDGSKLDRFVDPTFLAVLIRNLYETIAMFHLIYRDPKTEDEKIIIHTLWVIAGLSYRQRFESNIISDHARKKSDDEKIEIQKLIELVENNSLFKSLDLKNQNKIRNRIKQKEYLIKFDNNQIIFLSWKDLINLMGIKPGLFDNMYTYFSLYAHPSNVSVFQYGELFDDNQKSDLEMIDFNLEYAIFFTSIFIADYINLFPKVKETFNNMSLIEQILLNYPNKFIRGDSYSINDAWKSLG